MDLHGLPMGILKVIYLNTTILHKNKALTRDLPNSKDKGISGF